MDIVERLRAVSQGYVVFLNDHGVYTEAADEIERLREALRLMPKTIVEATDEIERLREDKAELLKALTGLYEVCCWEKVAPEIDAAKAAIAKATGG